MALSWNEINERAVKLFKEWADTTSEDAEAQAFLIEFFNVFGTQVPFIKGSSYHRPILLYIIVCLKLRDQLILVTVRDFLISNRIPMFLSISLFAAFRLGYSPKKSKMFFLHQSL